MNKNLITLIFVVATTTILVFLFRPVGPPDTDIQSFEFSGKIEGISENSVSVSGIFLPTDRELLNSEEIEITSVNIIADDDTRITRVTRFLPPLEKVSGLTEVEGEIYYAEFNAQDLEKEEIIVDFQKIKDDFQEHGSGMIVKVRSNENIFGKKKFTAAEVNYEIPHQHRTAQ